jgi:ferredoxin
LLMLFGWIGGKRGFVLYHAINPFNLFNFEFEGPPMVVMIVGSLLLGAVVYRPFCQFICPFGFVSWLAERVSLYRIRVSPTRCNGCGACGAACPTNAAKDIVAGRLFAADCYSCARCLTVCPHDAIGYCRRLEAASTE